MWVYFGKIFLHNAMWRRVSATWCQMKRCWLILCLPTMNTRSTHPLTRGSLCGFHLFCNLHNGWRLVHLSTLFL